MTDVELLVLYRNTINHSSVRTWMNNVEQNNFSFIEILETIWLCASKTISVSNT